MSTIETQPQALADDELSTLIRSRRTVHEFRAEAPPKDILLRAISNARWAPNHHRTEPWHFYILGDAASAKVARLNADLVRAARGEKAARIKLERWLAIPGGFVVTCERSADLIREQENYAACCCAVQNLMLYMWQYGLGVKWTTGNVMREDRFYELLGIDRQSVFVVGLFWYGFPAQIPEQHRKPVESIVTEID